MKVIAFLMMLLPIACQAANAEYLKIFMMQPRELILEKMDGVDELDRYLKEVEVNINKKISGMPLNQSWGFLVMAVRDDGKIKAWVDTDDAISQPIANAMTEVASNTKAFPVKQGAVIFALGFGIDGAALPINKMPFPEDWKKVSFCTNEDCSEVDAEAIVLKSW